MGSPPWLPWVLGLVLILAPRIARSQTSDGTGYAALAPIFAQRCVMCHSGTAAPLGLRLDSFEAVQKGSNRGPVVKAGDPQASELIRRLKGSSQPRMPMTGPPFLSDGEIALFERWIAGGLTKGGTVPAQPALNAVARRPAPGEPVTYLHVAPIFATRCAKCHTGNGLMGPAPEGFKLTSHEATLASTERARVVPGRPEASELLRRIRGQALPRMPFDGPPYLDDDEIRLIEDWIAQGAPDAAGRRATVPAGAAVRLHGTLGPGWRLDRLDLVAGRRTRIDKRPANGDYVEVRGRLDADGNVEAERIRRR